MSDPTPAEQAARARRRAEQHLIVEATMQARRAGKAPRKPDSGSGEIVTAILVLVVVFSMLFAVMRYGG